MMKCFDDEVPSARANGSVVVRFTVFPDGTVPAAIVLQRSTVEARVGNCVAARLRALRFGRLVDGRAVMVTHTFEMGEASSPAATAPATQTGSLPARPSQRSADAPAAEVPSGGRPVPTAAAFASPSDSGPCVDCGSVDAEALAAFARQSSEDLQPCYSASRRANGPVRGTLPVRAIIHPSGAVTSVEVRGNRTGSIGLAECVSERLRRWTFPSHATGGFEVAITLNFRFEHVSNLLPKFIFLETALAHTTRVYSRIPRSDTKGPFLISNADIDRYLVHQFMRGRSGAINRCYEALLDAAPDLAGQIDLEVEIRRSGRVQRVSVMRNDTGSGPLAGCLERTALGWTFPELQSAEGMTAQFPFKFAPSNFVDDSADRHE